jgi:ribosome biogenesis protein SSF1/2
MIRILPAIARQICGERKPQIAEVRPQTGRNRTRLSLELIKVENGLGAGDVLYHALVKKTHEEAAALKARKEGDSASKEQRRAEQEANVERKRKGAQDKREVKRNRQEERGKALTEALRSGQKVPDGNSSASGEESSAAEENVDE